MKRLYLRIYLAVLTSLAVLALAAGVFMHRLNEGEGAPSGPMIEAIATLALNTLPPSNAPRVEQQAALDKLFANLRADITGGFKSEVQPRYDASVASSRRLRGVF